MVFLASFKNGKVGAPRAVKIEIFDFTEVALTPVNIPCENFEGFERTRKRTILDSTKLDKIIRTLTNGKPAPSFSINTRGKMFIYYDEGSVDTACFSFGNRFILNGLVKELPFKDLNSFLKYALE